MKSKTIYECGQCGYRSLKWLGKCPGCGSWNTLTETIEQPPRTAKVSGTSSSAVRSPNAPQSIRSLSAETERRFSTGINELDRVLGGGAVKGELILGGGDPGIGKSTLLLQICRTTGERKKILYVSGEESAAQIKMRAERLNADAQGLYLLCETSLEAVIAAIEDMKPDIVIIDSIQTMYTDTLSSAAGSVPQVREATNAFMKTAKSMNITMFIVGHVTKDGAIAGPRVLEHMVDCVLYFEGDKQLTFRILRAVKNRFGSTNEIGVFRMEEKGLEEVESPSAALLDGRVTDISGSAIVCAMEGTRGVLAEVQALVTPSGFGNPRRTSAGIDLNRLFLLIAVLEKRVRINLSNSDIYVNVAGGLRIDETAADLGVCAAIAASKTDIVIPPDMMLIGEVGLGGELRAVSQLEKRLSEAVNMGFCRAVVPKQSLRNLKPPSQLTLYGAATVSEAIGICRTSHNQSQR